MTDAHASSAANALDGKVVVELCHSVAGPYAGQVLASLGATVIKIEQPPYGDATRGWGPPFCGDDSVMFAVLNCGKSSYALDLNDPEHLDQVTGHVRDADVLLQNWRPNKLAQFGLDYESVRDLNPSIVYCTMGAYGNGGPLSDQPGYDALIQAFSGLMSITGEPGGGPVRVGTSIMDMGTAIWAALGVVTALLHRERTGQGTHVTTSLLETGLAWLPYQVSEALLTDTDPLPRGSGMPMIVPYEAIDTSDQPIVIAAGSDGLWQQLCAALDRHDLACDDSLKTNAQRVEQRERVIAELRRTLATHTAAHWDEVLRRRGVPCSVVNTVRQAASHEQTSALGILRDIRLPSGTLQSPGMPMEFDGHRPRSPEEIPRLTE